MTPMRKSGGATAASSSKGLFFCFAPVDGLRAAKMPLVVVKIQPPGRSHRNAILAAGP